MRVSISGPIVLKAFTGIFLLKFLQMVLQHSRLFQSPIHLGLAYYFRINYLLRHQSAFISFPKSTITSLADFILYLALNMLILVLLALFSLCILRFCL